MREALIYVKGKSGTLITSLGALNWNLQLTVAVDLELEIVLVVPQVLKIQSIETYIRDQFGDIEIVDSIETKTVQERDRKVIEMADTILPIWNRSGGRMTKLIKSISKEKVDYLFQSLHKKGNSPVKYELSHWSDNIEKLPQNYLWHWTRSCDGSWPIETAGEFCRALLNSDHYPRSAMDTLRRILRSRKIIASGKCVTNSTPVVSFTENHPVDMVEHFSWRVGRHRMNFEPYAIGVPRELLEKEGAVPVRYNELPSWDVIASGERWKSEREWRVRGDVFLSDSMLEQIVVIVRSEHECTEFNDFDCFAYERSE